jgi:hypothetical protein
MQVPMDANALLDRECLGMRAKILELAATLDRLDRAEGGLAGDPRMAEMRQALKVLLNNDVDAGHAENVQRIYSRPYEEEWQKQLAMPGR